MQGLGFRVQGLGPRAKEPYGSHGFMGASALWAPMQLCAVPV